MENDPRWQPPMNGPYVSPGAGRPPAYAPYQRPAPPPVYGPPQPAYRPFVPPADNSCPMTATVCHLFIGLEFLCLCAAVGMIPFLLHRRTVWRAKQFAAYMDSEPEESVIELYGDRAVQISARGKTVIDYRLADFLLESADLIVLGGQGQVIAWRAEDIWCVPRIFGGTACLRPGCGSPFPCRCFPAGKRSG